jgi:hypothetical protein
MTISFFESLISSITPPSSIVQATSSLGIDIPTRSNNLNLNDNVHPLPKFLTDSQHDLGENDPKMET